MNDNSTKVVTGLVRFCYCHVFEPTAMNEGDTPKYNVAILIPKDDEKTVNAMKSVKTTQHMRACTLSMLQLLVSHLL